jgi:hypothetical protein
VADEAVGDTLGEELGMADGGALELADGAVDEAAEHAATRTTARMGRTIGRIVRFDPVGSPAPQDGWASSGRLTGDPVHR